MRLSACSTIVLSFSAARDCFLLCPVITLIYKLRLRFQYLSLHSRYFMRVSQFRPL